MFKVLALLVSGVFLLGAPNGVSAQVSDLALGQAKARLACGTGTIVSSQFLPNGSLEVTCAQYPANATSNLVAGTGLTTPAALGLVAVVVVLGVLIGDSGDGTTTTPTTTSPVATR